MIPQKGGGWIRRLQIICLDMIDVMDHVSFIFLVLGLVAVSVVQTRRRLEQVLG